MSTRLGDVLEIGKRCEDLSGGLQGSGLAWMNTLASTAIRTMFRLLPRWRMMSGWVCRIILLATIYVRSILTALEIAVVPGTTFSASGALVCARRDCEAS